MSRRPHAVSARTTARASVAHPTTSRRRTATFAGLVTAAAIGLAVAPAPGLAATKTLDYRCVWPYIGEQPLSVGLDVAVGAATPMGRSTGEVAVGAQIVAGGQTSDLPGIVGMETLEGTMTVPVSVTSGGATQGRTAQLTLPRTKLPGGYVDIPLSAAGSFGSVTFASSGPAVFSAGTPSLNLTARTASGGLILVEQDLTKVPATDTAEETFDVACSPAGSTPDATIATTTVGTSTDTTPPTAPGRPSAVADERSALVTWAPATDASGVLSYEITYNGITRAVNGTSATLTGLSADTAYTVSVRAKDTALNLSAASEPASFRTARGAADAQPPTAPSGPRPARITDTSIEVFWSGSTDNLGVTGYDVVRNGVVVASVGGRTYNATIPDLAPSTSYDLQIVAKDDGGNRTPGVAASLRTGVAGGGTVPSQPQGLVVTKTSTSFAVRWAASVDDGPVAGYELSLDGVVTRTTEPSASFTGLLPDTGYGLEVRAYDAAGNVSEKALVVVGLPSGDPAPGPVPSRRSLTYACTFPGGVEAPVRFDFTAAPVTVADGSGGGPRWAMTVQAAQTPQSLAALSGIGASVVAAEVYATTTFTAPGGAVERAVRFLAPPQSPDFEESTVTPAGSALIDGTNRWTIDALRLNLRPRTAYGQWIEAGSTDDSDRSTETFDVPCRLSPDTQDRLLKLLTVSGNGSNVTEDGTPVGETVTEVSYAISGASAIKTLTKGTVPLSGTAAARFGTPSGSFSADLTLAPAKASLTALGFLPVTAQINMASTDQVAGTLKAGKLSAVAKVRVRLASVKLFGIGLAGGDACQAKQVSSIALQSTQSTFVPQAGGSIAGTFAISDLTGCGALTGIVSPLTKGSGNAVTLNLTPKA